jgi:hypothetical protein
MPGARLPMRNIRDVLRLTAAGMSSRKIAASSCFSSYAMTLALQAGESRARCSLRASSTRRSPGGTPWQNFFRRQRRVSSRGTGRLSDECHSQDGQHC